VNPLIDKNIQCDFLLIRQYLISPEPNQGFLNWKEILVDHKVILTYHPDLEFSKVSNERFSLFLLGFVLDPKNIRFSNLDILESISDSSKNFDDVLERVSFLGGRYVIIYKDSQSVKVFHDPAGSRQVFYCFDKLSRVWCSSQPHVLADKLGVDKSSNPKLLNFINSKTFKKKEFPWVGDGTIFEGVKHLIPNHYLDLKTGLAFRYWPNKKLLRMKFEDVVGKASDLLAGLIESASHRYSLVMPVTSGWDSNVLLAASRNCSKSIYYFIYKHESFSDFHSDISYPSKLFGKLSLGFSVIPPEAKMDSNFNSLLEKNVTFFHSETKKLQNYCYFKRFQNSVLVEGGFSEVSRCYYRSVYGTVDEKKLALVHGFPKDEFVIENCYSWLIGAVDNCYKSNVNVLDLFYWEQRMGNWGANFFSELDVSLETLHPFNCRGLMELMLSVDSRFRSRSYSYLYYRMMKVMWPEVSIGFFWGNFRQFKNIVQGMLKASVKRLIYFFSFF
jgi:hypothetical protein